MGTKKDFGIVLIICAIFASMLLISPIIVADSQVDSEIVTKAFQTTGAKLTRLQVNGWIKVNGSESSNGLAGDSLHDRVQKLFRYGFTGAEKSGNDGLSPIKVVEGTINSDIYVKMVLKKVFPSSKTAAPFIYLAASVTTQNNTYSLADLNRYLLLIIPERDIHRSIILTGTFPGEISPPQVNKVLQKVILTTGAQNVETMEDGHLVSIAGYIPDVPQRLTCGEKLFNINIAVKYNSVEKKTFLYIGSPTITNEY